MENKMLAAWDSTARLIGALLADSQSPEEILACAYILDFIIGKAIKEAAPTGTEATINKNISSNSTTATPSVSKVTVKKINKEASL